MYLPVDGFLKVETYSKVLLETTNIYYYCVVTAFSKKYTQQDEVTEKKNRRKSYQILDFNMRSSHKDIHS
jgi:hypothetical protein